MYKIILYTPNHSANPLRTTFLNRRVALRLGSSKQHNISSNTLLLNSIEGVKISSNKILSKKAMDVCNIHHAEWIHITSIDNLTNFFRRYNTIIIKKYNSCKGKDIYYVDSEESLNSWISEHELECNKYIAEKYYFYKREYRFHVDRNHGIFYACRKLLKNDAEETWHRHDCNSVWILPSNPKFKKPSFIKQIEADCIKYMDYVCLDICAFDVKSNDSNFIIMESNTAPSLGEIGIQVYRNHLQKYYNETI